jgi:hypothetical protein
MSPEMSFREPVNFPYKSLEDIPPNVLAMLKKDPNFDLETFLTKVGWSDADKTRIQEKLRGTVSSGVRKGEKDEAWGLYSPMSDMSFLNYQKFGESEPLLERFDIKSPSDADKVQTILHEMRHGKMKEPWFMKSSAIPKWVREYEERGEPHYLDKDIKDKHSQYRDTQKDVSGEELFVRFMDQRFGDVAEPGTIAGSDYKPYFDKILKDHWEPYAKRYEDILKEEKRVKSKPYGLAGGGIAGMLGEPAYEDEEHRVPYKDGKTGFKLYPKASLNISENPAETLEGKDIPGETVGIKNLNYGGTLIGEKDGLYGGIDYLKIKNKIDFMKENQTLFKDTTDDEKMDFIFGKKGDNYDIRFKTDKDFDNKQLTLNWTFNEGGRAGYKDGRGPKMSRRNFLKIMGGLAALPVVGKLFKFTKPLAKTAKVADLTSVPIGNAAGMPAWFKPLVNKVIKEGDDVTKKFATQERQVVHKTELPDSKTDVMVTQNLNTGDVVVDIGLQKHGFADGKFGQPVRLEYKASEEIEPVINSWTGKVDTKGKKTPEEFNVEEAEFTGGHPENVKFEEVTVNKFGKHESNFDEVEAFAKGKTKKGARKVSESFDKMNEDIADRFANYPRPDDYASGGRVPRSGGGIMKLLKTILKKTPKKSYERVDLKKLLKGKDKIPVYSGSMKRSSNTWKSFVEDAEKLGTTPEKIAKDKFKGQWFTPFRSYAESFMNPKDLTSKMRTVELTPKEIAIAKRYVEKVNKKDMLVSMRKKLNIKPFPKQSITTSENLVLIPRYKLKKLKKENRIMTDYLIKDKIKSKLGLAEGGVAGMLGE